MRRRGRDRYKPAYARRLAALMRANPEIARRLRIEGDDSEFARRLVRSDIAVPDLPRTTRRIILERLAQANR